MKSIFKKATASSKASHLDPSSPPPSPSTPSESQEKQKKTKGFFVKERDLQKRPLKSPRNRRNSDDNTHPLNRYEPGDDLRRHSALTTMSSPRDSLKGGVPVGSDSMETTPAPEAPGAFPSATTNGTNGEHQSQEEERPAPPPHGRSTPPPPREIRPEDAEAFKAAGNKFYKAGQYAKAIEEYTQGLWMR
jgi:DnaJ family protein C protein 7